MSQKYQLTVTWRVIQHGQSSMPIPPLFAHYQLRNCALSEMNGNSKTTEMVRTCKWWLYIKQNQNVQTLAQNNLNSINLK